MRASTTILTLFLLIVAGAAQAQSEPRPDYSSEGLLKLFAGTPETSDDRKAPFGAVDFGIRGTTIRLHWLPMLLLPLSGTELGVTNTWPDAFSLTNTQIATSPRAWRTQRAVNAELRRIEKMERAKIRVKTQ